MLGVLIRGFGFPVIISVPGITISAVDPRIELYEGRIISREGVTLKNF